MFGVADREHVYEYRSYCLILKATIGDVPPGSYPISAEAPDLDPHLAPSEMEALSPTLSFSLASLVSLSRHGALSTPAVHHMAEGGRRRRPPLECLTGEEVKTQALWLVVLAANILRTSVVIAGVDGLLALRTSGV